MSDFRTREGFEWWDKFSALQRFMFQLHKEDGEYSVKKVPFDSGFHIELGAASGLVSDMQDEINDLKKEIKELRKPKAVRIVT